LEVAAATAAGQTSLTMINGPATMELVVPDGAFALDEHVAFSVQQLAADPPETWGAGDITTLAEYQFQFAIQTLGMAATLNFEIDVSTLDMSAQDALLALLDTEPLLTLSVLGDEPGAEPQLFDVCAAGGMPSVGGCVAVLWLDGNGMLLEPFGPIDPSVLRFEALVGHFSTYSIVAAATLPGDFNNDGTVDAADYVVWRKNDGSQAGYDIWRANFGRTAGSGTTTPLAAVPEAAAFWLAITGIGIWALFRRHLCARPSSACW
jgi:hypothetical protein